MTDDADWPARLARAAEALARTAAAPSWLAQAVADAAAVAADLAPRTEAATEPPDFYYPH
jgi:hypothetical protein